MSVYIESYCESLNKYGEELCGDTAEIIRTKDYVVAALADGLGSGVKANILSTLTSKIIATMLSGGSTIEEAVDTITNTLPVCRERGIAYCTFTIIQIFESGDVYIVEFDNPELIVLRRGQVLQVPGRERVINGKIIHEKRFKAIPEDTFVAFSDGAVHAGVGHVLNLGWQRPNIVEHVVGNYRPVMSAAGMTKMLLSACDCLYGQKPGDDTTVLTLRVRRPKQLNMIVGPPAERERDEEYVYRFVSLPGMHVVCGGTTSQLLCRVLDRQLHVSMEYMDPEIPPTARVEGMDLVTEGVLTLSKALEYVEDFCEEGGKASGMAAIRGQNGAAQLARLLVEDCTKAHIMLGMARNPAHQNPGLPLAFDIKQRILNDLARCLRSMGKEVEIETY